MAKTGRRDDPRVSIVRSLHHFASTLASPGWSKLALVGEFALTSEAFTQGDVIPRRHTCEGEAVSPALSWTEPPAGTRALALIVDDPDAPIGTFTHWLAWNIDPVAGGLAEGESAPASGRNDFGAGGWSG